jgi:hypothetical protein
MARRWDQSSIKITSTSPKDIFVGLESTFTCMNVVLVGSYTTTFIPILLFFRLLFERLFRTGGGNTVSVVY